METHSPFLADRHPRITLARPQGQPLSHYDDGRLMARAALDALREPVLLLDGKLRVAAANRAVADCPDRVALQVLPLGLERQAIGEPAAAKSVPDRQQPADRREHLLLKAQSVQSQETRNPLENVHSRIMSVATVQQQLLGTKDAGRIALAPYLARLRETLGASMVADNRSISIACRVDDTTVPATEAVSLGLIVTELVLNALKHAFVDNLTAGRIAVTYDLSGDAWCFRQRHRKAPAADDAGSRHRHHRCAG